MPRTLVATLAGLLGFLLYVGVVVALADPVVGMHWLPQLAYYLVAGLAWTWPAARLMRWAARG